MLRLAVSAGREKSKNYAKRKEKKEAQNGNAQA